MCIHELDCNCMLSVALCVCVEGGGRGGGGKGNQVNCVVWCELLRLGGEGLYGWDIFNWKAECL